jgi:uncharacterized protein (DUF1697 family)
MSKALCRYVALLRAINGGQVNTIPKEDLRSVFAESGAGWAETYITSGNVVFECLPAKLAAILEKAHERLRQPNGSKPARVDRRRCQALGAPSFSPYRFIWRNGDL